MHIPRHFTDGAAGPYSAMNFVPRTSKISNPDGTVVFKAENVLVPETWSQVATDILAQKYFRRAGVPAATRPVPEDGIPGWLQRRVPAEGAELGGELDARQIFDRLAGCWTYWGSKAGLFDGEEDARAFFDEHRYMLSR